MGDFNSVLVMMLGYILIVITALREVPRYYPLTDFGKVVLMMITVSIVPIIARPIYFWMIAQNYEGEDKSEVQRKRGIIVKTCFGIASLIMVARIVISL